MNEDCEKAGEDTSIDSLDEFMKALVAKMQTEAHEIATQKLFEATVWELNQVILTSED